MNITIYDGAELAQSLTACGCPCVFNGHTVAPSAVVYRFSPSSPETYTERKAKTAAERLGVIISRPVRFSVTLGGFSVAIAREARRFAKLWALGDALKTAPRPSIPLGLDDDGNAQIIELEAAPHLLVAGASGSGKTSYLHAVIGALSCYSNADLILIDAKRVEFPLWRNSSHLVAPIITDAETAAHYLRRVCAEMEKRYKILQAQGLRDNSRGTFSPLVIVVDELADLILTAKSEIEPQLITLAQKGRAAGIHLILATQRPTVNVICGLILANIPCRVCLSVASVRDSVVMLDHKGGEALQGKGDCIIKLPTGAEFHAQAPYLTAADIAEILADSTPRKFKPIKQPRRRGIRSFFNWLFSSPDLTVDELNDYDEILDDNAPLWRK